MKIYEYDVAFSVATEDIKVAEAIAKQLRIAGIKYYLFTEENAIGKNLKAETWDIYRDQSQFILLLISKHYVERYWSTEEFQVVETVKRKGHPFIIPIRMDDTIVPGLSTNNIFLKWENNPAEIVNYITGPILNSHKERLKLKKQKSDAKLKDKKPLPNNIYKDSIIQKVGNMDSSNVIGKNQTNKE
jgi:hypothetical protein